MSNELLATATTGQTLYVLLIDATGQVYNGSTFETPADVNWSTYDIAMTEAGTTGIYRASMLAVSAGAYSWLVYKQAGASPAVGDTVVGSGTIRWTGTAEETVPASANVTHHAGVAVAAADANGNVPVNVKLWKGSAPSDLDANSYVRVDVLAWDANPVDERYPYVTPVDSSDGVNTIDYLYIRDAMKLAPSAGAPAAGSVDAHLDALALEATAQAILEDTGTTLPTAIAAIEPGGGSYAGDGIGYYSDTIDDGTSPLDGVRVQLYTSPNRVGPAYEAYTNALGVFEMWPDPGTYYRWLDLAGYNFSQDVAVTVTEP